MIFFGESSLKRAIQEYVDHNHLERSHQGIGNTVIERYASRLATGAEMTCDERLGGLLRHYRHAAKRWGTTAKARPGA